MSIVIFSLSKCQRMFFNASEFHRFFRFQCFRMPKIEFLIWYFMADLGIREEDGGSYKAGCLMAYLQLCHTPYTLALMTITHSCQQVIEINGWLSVRLWYHSFALRHPSDEYHKTCSGFILCMHSPNERRHYIVTSSHIGWAHTQNDPCMPIGPGGGNSSQHVISIYW